VKITATEEYGMRCMLQLALRSGQTVSLAELAETEGLALPFAAKVLAQLRRASLVVAVRGRHGGYQLAVPPERISVAAILAATGRPLFDSSFCRTHSGPMGDDCARLSECALRPVWSHLDALLRQFFGQTTLADLAAGERKTHDYLAAHWPLQRRPRGTTSGAATRP